jgi:glutamate-1-semialdehyde 2,1-aminomutase
VEFLWRQGERLRTQVNRSIGENGVQGHFDVIGLPCNLIFVTKDEHGNRSQAYRTLFLQELIRRGVLAPSFVVSFSHTDNDIDRTADAVHAALATYRKALDQGIDTYLEGRPVKPVNRRFN